MTNILYYIAFFSALFTSIKMIVDIIDGILKKKGDVTILAYLVPILWTAFLYLSK